jgi:hypothetical protein
MGKHGLALAVAGIALLHAQQTNEEAISELKG